MTTTGAEAVEGFRNRWALHCKRMAEDPEYRAQREREERERKEKEEAEHRAWREEWAARARLSRWRAAGIPERVQRLLDAPQRTDAVAAVRRFVADPDRTLLLLAGGVGCGKTVAACVGMDERDAAGEAAAAKADAWYSPSGKTSFRFVKAIDLTRAGTYDSDFWHELEVAGLLVIDDLGTEPRDEKGWASANLAALLDARYDACRKTIITTNLNAERFKAIYGNDGGRLIDRLREAGSFVELAGASLRKAPSRPTGTTP